MIFQIVEADEGRRGPDRPGPASSQEVQARSASSAQVAEDRQVHSSATASRKFPTCVSTLDPPAARPASSSAFPEYRLVGHVHVTPASTATVDPALTRRGRPLPGRQPGAHACQPRVRGGLVTGPRRCAAAAWVSAAAKVSPPVGPPRSGGNSAGRGSFQAWASWPRTSLSHQTSSGRHRRASAPAVRAAPSRASPCPSARRSSPADHGRIRVHQPQPASSRAAARSERPPGHRIVAGSGRHLHRMGSSPRQAAEDAPGRARRAGPGPRSRRCDGASCGGRSGRRPAGGSLADLTPVAGLQEPEEEVERLRLAPAGPRGLIPLRLGQEPVRVRRLELHGEHARVLRTVPPR